MRLRKASVRGSFGSATVHFRGTEGQVQDVTAIIGGNNSGKTSLCRAIASLCCAKVGDRLRPGWDIQEAIVEFELGSELGVGVIQDGVVVQAPPMKFEHGLDNLRNGLLYYDSMGRSEQACGGKSFGNGLISVILRDLYAGEVSQCVIIVDDMELGLDDSSAREFLAILIRKSLERDNQLIVLGKRDALFGGIDPGAWRRLSSPGITLIQEVIAGLNLSR
jgi:predicted ATPase